MRRQDYERRRRFDHVLRSEHTARRRQHRLRADDVLLVEMVSLISTDHILKRQTMRSKLLIAVIAALAAVAVAGRVSTASRGIMLMNRISPSTIDLFIANADGTGERKLFADSDFNYDASFSADGRWIVFTSERGGYGQA